MDLTGLMPLRCEKSIRSLLPELTLNWRIRGRLGFHVQFSIKQSRNSSLTLFLYFSAPFTHFELDFSRYASDFSGYQLVFFRYLLLAFVGEEEEFCRSSLN